MIWNFILIWLLCGTVGFLIGVFSDYFLYKQKTEAIIFWFSILAGPISLWIAIKSVWRYFK